MTHELLLHQMTVKRLTALMGLSPRDVEMLLLLHTSRSLSTPSIHRLMGTRKSDINKIVGPTLMSAGLVKCESVVHNTRLGMPTTRWSLVEETTHQLDELIRVIRRDALMKLGEVFNEDRLWSKSTPPASVS